MQDHLANNRPGLEQRSQVLAVAPDYMRPESWIASTTKPVPMAMSKISEAPRDQGKVKLVVMVAPDVKVASVAVLSTKPAKLALSVYFPAAAVSTVNTSVPGAAT